MDLAWFEDAKEDMMTLDQEYQLLMSNADVKLPQKEAPLEMIGKAVRRSTANQILRSKSKKGANQKFGK